LDRLQRVDFIIFIIIFKRRYGNYTRSCDPFARSLSD